MRKIHFLIILIAITVSGYTQSLQPYIKATTSEAAISELKKELSNHLQNENIKILGEYAPADDADRYILVITSDDLLNAVKKIKGLAGFAATLRIALTKEEGGVVISYTNPFYWGNAYLRSDYPEVESYYKNLGQQIENAMKQLGDYSGTPFGSEEGIEVDELRKYRYMFGMPRFDDIVELNKFSSYNEAVEKIDSNIKKGVDNVELVYACEIPNEKLKLYGFALKGENGEASFMPKIDITNPKHTAFLPYEMLVIDGAAFMLHGRFRIALSFPDLTMGTFTKIMSTPGDIKDLLKSVTED